MKLFKIIGGILLILAISTPSMGAKKVSIAGIKPHLEEYLYNSQGITTIGAVTFMVDTTNAKSAGFRSRLYILGTPYKCKKTSCVKGDIIKIYGKIYKNDVWSKKPVWHECITPYKPTPTIDGRNHDLKGNLIPHSTENVPSVGSNTEKV